MAIALLLAYPTLISSHELQSQSIYDIVREATERHGVPFDEIWATIRCETAGTFDPAIQSRHVFPDGRREESYGLAQIFLPAHPYVTKAEAIDPHFAAEFISKNWKAHKSWWVCARKL